MKEYIILLIGVSGAGKSTIASELSFKYGLKELQSYTDRPKRNTNDNSHIFLTKGEMDALLTHNNGDDICGYTNFNGYRYCATNKLVDSSDIYIIDIEGVKFFKEKYKGNKIPIIIGIKIDAHEALCRMIERGDSIACAYQRQSHDEIAFEDLGDIVDIMYDNTDINALTWIVDEIFVKFFYEGNF